VNGLSDLRMVESQHMISRVWDGPQHHMLILMLHKIVCSNRCLTVHRIAEECVILKGCHDILMTKLEMHHVVSKFVPRLLTHDQRDSCTAICQKIIDRARG
jgi:hypothetical protein